ncbi:MAG: alpha-E domain-containing protein [Paludibacteraceae bacterium]|nr:alpha-E domain-containing protein [Paludibacteraceae bacterium]
MVISANKANRLFWLGRYVERVYMTLHLLRRVSDKMIDGQPADYEGFWKKLDVTDSYSSTGEFTLGMMYDDQNPGSILSSLNRAMDNAIMLREDIKSETMSYIEMSISLMKSYRAEAMANITNLQPVTDWMLAFRGSAAQRIDSSKILSTIAIGQIVEKIDIMLRFCYCYERIATQYNMLKNWAKEWPELIDENVDKQIEAMLTPESYAKADENFRWKLCNCINSVVRA